MRSEFVAAPDADGGAPGTPLLFLSHAGTDTEAAHALKRKLEKAAAERGAALEVWFDKGDLIPGLPWRRQLEEAIGRATAFAVYVGSKGVVNWVEAEVDLALSRATGGGDGFAFVPVISASAPAGASAGTVKLAQ